MDPVSLIVAALVAGVAAGGQEVAAKGVRDAYAALRKLLVRRFGNGDVVPHVSGATVLDAHESDPRTWEAPLAAALKASGADRDHAILEAAKSLLERADPQGALAGKYHVDARGAQGVQIGDYGTMSVNVGGARPGPRNEG